MGKKRKTTQYQDYHISWLHGFCHGPVDALVQVWMNEKAIMGADDIMYGNSAMRIDKPDLFGGFEREGGVEGDMHWLAGGPAQTIPSALAARVGYGVNNYPGLRGFGSLFFCGNNHTDRAGMRVSSNMPRVPTVWARMQRSSKGLPGNNGIILGPKNERDVNPAHMVWEVLTSSAWGMGGSPMMLNQASFTATASTLFDEKFGLSMLWTKQSTVESFIQEVCDHVQGMVFFNPFTGLVHFKLIRDDYDRNTLPEVGPDTARLIQFRRPLWGETINEITITWTRPETEQEETMTFQDIGNIAMQGDVVPENRNYYGIRNAALAQFVGERDMVTAATPLVTAQIKANRRDWRHLPGDVIRFTWPAHGIVRMIMRVMDVDWGTPDNAEITVNLMEDIFALGYAEFGRPQEGEWTDPGQDPNGDNMENLPVKWVAPPYTAVQWIADAYDFNLGDEYYPQIMISALVSPEPKDFDSQGNPLPHQEDVQSFIMNVPDTMPNGDPVWTSVGEKTITGRADVVGTLAQEVTSILEYKDRYGGNGPKLGGIGLIGNEGTNEWEEEWVLFTEQLDATRWRIQRGLFDTIPRQWTSGTVVWFIGPESNVFDPTERLADEIERYKLQARTSLGIRDLDKTPVVSTRKMDRVYRPYRPANCRVEGVMFGTVDDDQFIPPGIGTPSLDYKHIPRKWTVSVSWANRHRAMEDTIYRRWDEGNVVPEDGQTTEIIILPGHKKVDPGIINPENSGEITRITGLTGTTHTFDIMSTTARLTKVTLVFISRRNGLQSLQFMDIRLTLYFKGFGYDWGWMYGGWPDSALLTTIDDSEDPQLVNSFRTQGNIKIEQPMTVDVARIRVAAGTGTGNPAGNTWPFGNRLRGFRTRYSSKGHGPIPGESYVNLTADED